MNTFEIGDRVVYNPNTQNLLPNTQRPRNVGTIVDIDPNYLHIKFNRNMYDPMSMPIRILPSAVTHYSQSNKGIRKRHANTFRNTLQNIPRAREGMEARKVWNTYVNLPFMNGPGRNEYASYWPKTVAPNRPNSRMLTQKHTNNRAKTRASKTRRKSKN